MSAFNWLSHEYSSLAAYSTGIHLMLHMPALNCIYNLISAELVPDILQS